MVSLRFFVAMCMFKANKYSGSLAGKVQQVKMFCVHRHIHGRLQKHHVSRSRDRAPVCSHWPVNVDGCKSCELVLQSQRPIYEFRFCLLK